jgi:ApaG protein
LVVILSRKTINHFNLALCTANMEILTTNGVTIMVDTQFLPAHSQPRENKYVFGYHITVKNACPYPVKLLRRHWVIREADGSVREVEGEGVVGLQPVIHPGNSHSYSSFCNLATEIGKMQGEYLMAHLDDGTFFEVTIPEFRLISPAKMN